MTVTAHYSGITSDLETKKKQHMAEKKSVRNWRVANGGLPFSSREAAQQWENA